MRRKPFIDSRTGPASLSATTGKLAVALRRPGGATLDGICAEFGWLKHSARAAISRVNKAGHRIIKGKNAAGVKTYSCAGPS